MKWMIVAGLLVAGPAWASGGADTVPFTVDPYGGSPAEQDAFYGGGHVGVLQGRAPWSRLFAAWRLLHGLPVGVEAGHSLALPCCDTLDSGVQKAWLVARKAVPGVADIAFIDTARPLPDYVSVQTCFPDAFKIATTTLADRIASHGAADTFVRAWLDGQDAVFKSCSEDTPMVSLPADAPAWLAKDRDYQLAAQALYARDFPVAEARFAAIASDAGSPWKPLAPYLAARAAVRAALPGKDAGAMDRARNRLAALSSPDAFGHGAVAGLTGALDFRAAPDARRTAVAALLSGPTLSATAASDFKDSRRLGQSPAGTPAYLDWIAVFGRTPDKPEGAWFEHYKLDTVWITDADTLAHARAQWDATHDPAWLVAAMEWTAPGDGADLVAAAKALPATAPAYLSAFYHRIRLTMASADEAATRAELDTVLARTDLSRSDRNLFLAERAMLAADGQDFRKVAVRQQPCSYLDDDDPASPPTGCVGQRYGLEYYEPTDPSGRFGADAVATIDRLPLNARTALASNTDLPAPLRLDLTVTNWTRAVLLDAPSADRLARELAALLPPMAPELTRFAGTPPGADKRFAAWFILAKMPGASVDANTTPASMADSGVYVRPTNDVKTSEGHWPDWLFLPGTAAARAAALPDLPGDAACFGQCGGGAFPYHQPGFVDAKVAAAERGRFLPPKDAPGAVHVWEELLGYVQAHPSDPRAPEALYWLVRISRFGHGHARSSFRAFKLLKARYATTPWAKETRYFYD